MGHNKECIIIDATTKVQLQSDNLGEQVISTQTETSISALDPTLEDDKQMTMEETTVKVQGKYIYFILSISLVYRKNIFLIHSFYLNCKFSFHVKRARMEVVRIQ